MRIQKIALALTAINLGLILFVLAHLGPTTEQRDTSVLRGRVLELVDDKGQIRAQLRVEPDGEVVLRLRDEMGTIRVKLAAGRDGSGLALLNDATELGVHILAKAEGSSVKLVNKDTLPRVIIP